MATIEERAVACCMTKFPNHETADAESMRIGYIQGATEQDRIARQEERERCVKVAQDYHCNNHCKGYCTMYSACKNCNEREEIRKALEGGSDGTES